MTFVKSFLLLLGSLFISGALSACIPRSENRQCNPITYPSGEETESDSYEVIRLQVNAPFKDVVDYYTGRLEPTSVYRDWTLGEWQVEKINEKQVLFDCVAHLNAVELERGCILVMEAENQTIIETVWYLSADEAPICDRDLSIDR